MTDIWKHWPADVRRPTAEEFAAAKKRWHEPFCPGLERAMVEQEIGLWLPFFYRDMTEELRPWFKRRVAEIERSSRSI